MNSTYKVKMLAKSRKSKSQKEFQRTPKEFKDFFKNLATVSLYGDKEKEELAKLQTSRTTNPHYFSPLSKPQAYPFCPKSKKLNCHVESR